MGNMLFDFILHPAFVVFVLIALFAAVVALVIAHRQMCIRDRKIDLRSEHAQHKGRSHILALEDVVSEDDLSLIHILKKNRTRTIVTIIGIMLSAAMICASTTLVSSMQNFVLRCACLLYTSLPERSPFPARITAYPLRRYGRGRTLP